MHRDEPEPVARRRVPLGEGVQQDDVARDDRGDAVEALDEGRVGGVVDHEQVGPVGLDDPAQLLQTLRPHRAAVGVARVDEEEDLDPRVTQHVESALVEPVRLVGHGLDLHDVEPDPLEDRDLEVRRVGRGGDRDGVTRADDPVHLERREDVGHGRRAALGGEHVEPVVVVERRTREPQHVALGHLLEVRLHPVRRRVSEPEHGPDQLVHPLVGVEPELTDRELHGAAEEGGAHVGAHVLGEVGEEALVDPGDRRHLAPDVGGAVCVRLLRGEQAEAEERRSRFGDGPVRLSPPRVDHGPARSRVRPPRSSTGVRTRRRPGRLLPSLVSPSVVANRAPTLPRRWSARRDPGA